MMLRYLTKLFYKLLIFKIILIDKEKFNTYSRLKTFGVFEMPTNLGIVKLILKEDRRSRGLEHCRSLVHNFLVELEYPDDITPIRQDITKKVIVIVMFNLCNIDYKILSEVLVDYYLDSICEYIENNSESKDTKQIM